MGWSIELAMCVMFKVPWPFSSCLFPEFKFEGTAYQSPVPQALSWLRIGCALCVRLVCPSAHHMFVVQVVEGIPPTRATVLTEGTMMYGVCYVRLLVVV